MAKHGTMRGEVKGGVATIFLDRPDKKNALPRTISRPGSISTR